jgi:hypothetical protein
VGGLHNTNFDLRIISATNCFSKEVTVLASYRPQTPLGGRYLIHYLQWKVVIDALSGQGVGNFEEKGLQLNS